MYVSLSLPSPSHPHTHTQMSQSTSTTHWPMPPTSGQISLTFLATPKSSRSSLVTFFTSMMRLHPGGSGHRSGSLD